MIEKLKHKYALSDKGANDMVRAFFAVTLANLVLMMPVGLLYLLSSYLLEGEVPKEKLPFFIVAIIGGSIGSIIGMYAFRHKTRHWYFVYGMPAILILQILLIALLLHAPFEISLL